MNKIEVKNLCFAYNKQSDMVINHISFRVKEGSYVSIIGHNGSGKSTLARLLIGLLAPNDGEIYVADQLVTNKNIKSIRQKIGLVFQNPDNQFIGATVEDDIAFGLENRRIPRKEMQDIINKYAERVGMIEYLQKEPSRLSGGQKQRVAIAGALSLEPEILILDEATSMLDPKGKKDIRDLISEMKKLNPSLTILSITHDVEEAFLSDEVLVLSKGEIAFKGKPEEVFSNRNALQSLKLGMPFVLDIKDHLKKEGIEVKCDNDIENIAEVLWPSK